VSAEQFADADDILLEAEVAPAMQAQFESNYAAITGTSPAGHQHYQSQPNKWGLECRVYFNAPPSVVADLHAAGYHVEDRDGGYHGDYAYRINSVDLFWELVRRGYRLGPNAPLP
jgi:hypothetical protein